MKKLKLWGMLLISLIILPSIVMAKNASITITSSSQIVLGNTVTVTVKLSSNDAIGSWEMQLNYDKNYLQLTSSNAEGSGNYMVGYATGASGVKSKSYTFKFKTLKTGSTKLSISSLLVYDNDMDEMTVSTSNKTVKIITQQQLEDSYSKDNNLKSLSVEGYPLSPEFNKDTLNYSINVPEGTTSIKVDAKANDSKASISGDGTLEVTEGINTINVVVRAENGSEKTYVILVNVIDQNPININIGNLNYTVIKLRNNYSCPDLFIEKDININDFTIPACYNENLNYTLVGLKKEDGTVESYIYNNGKYSKYLETMGTTLKLVILDYNDSLEGLKKYEENIDGHNYQVFKASKNSNNYVVYGINVATGEKNFYNYDSINKTFTLYDNERIEEISNLNKTFFYIIIAFGIGLCLSLICLFKMNKSKNNNNNKEKIVKEEAKDNQKEIKESKKDKKKEKKKKEKQKKEIEENIIKEDINEIKEKVNNDEEQTKEFYDIFEDEKNKKKK